MTSQHTPAHEEPALESQPAETVADAGAGHEERESLRADNEKLRDQWLRAVAEMENLRKRAQRDVEETGKYAVSGFARDLVGVVENLQRALDSIPEGEQNPQLQSFRQGVEMTLKELLGAFERNGIVRVDPIGQKFDHNLHQAVAQVEAPDTEPGTVMQVMQAGYVIHGRLLRPAMVAVAKQGAAAKMVDTTA